MDGHHIDLADFRPEQLATVRRVTVAGLIVNLLLAVGKGAAGVVGQSQAVVADGVHSLSDLTSDIAVLIGMRYWSEPADAEHPHGHRRIETLVSLFIGGLLAVVALGLIHEALEDLGRAERVVPGWIAFAAALVSIVAKEILYRWTARAGKRARSSALAANAWHHRTDALSSIPAALAVAGAQVVPEWWFLDAVGTVVVSFLILQGAVGVALPAARQCVDTAAPRADRDAILRITEATSGVMSVHRLRTRYLGPDLGVDLHVTVSGELTVRQGHDIAELVKSRIIGEGPDVVDVEVHIEPEEATPAP